MNASVQLLRHAVSAAVQLRTTISSSHASAPILGTQRIGTGAILAGSGLILTAHYLLVGAGEIDVETTTGESFSGQVLGIDFRTGLGVVALNGRAPNTGLVPRPLAEVPVGGEAFVVAVSLEGPRASDGIVTSTSRFEAFWEYRLEPAIFLSASSPEPGGGPVVDLSGRLIGIAALALADVGKLTLAIPADAYLRVEPELERSGRLPSVAPRAWLGITCYALRGHVVIAGALPGSPAAHAGFQPGDVVLAIDGEQVAERGALYEQIWQHAPGDVVEVKVFRESGIQDLRVKSSTAEEFFA